MPKGKDLGLNRGPSLKSLPNRTEQRENDRKHSICKLPFLPFKFNWLNATEFLAWTGMPAHLWENLTGVVPELAWNWVKFFTYLAAQQRSWSDESLQLFGLRLRNLIAVGGKVTPVTMKALETAIQFKPKT